MRMQRERQRVREVMHQITLHQGCLQEMLMNQSVWIQEPHCQAQLLGYCHRQLECLYHLLMGVALEAEEPLLLPEPH
jgi:hypothetical protein